MALSTKERGNFQRQINEMKELLNKLEKQLEEGGGNGGEITSESITDATEVGKSVLKASSEAAARTAIGAGTSNLALGSTASTAATGDHVHSEYATQSALEALEQRVEQLEGA